jgi:transcription antitermination factor NusG
MFIGALALGSLMQNVGRVRAGWYVLAVMSGNEGKALEGLKGIAGVVGYVPMRSVSQKVHHKEAIKIGCRRKNVRRVVFPGYVFVHFNPTTVPMSKVLADAKALSFVSGGGVLAVVPERFIAAMRESEASGQWDKGVAAVEKLVAAIGSQWTIQTGAWAGFVGVLRSVALGGLAETATVDVEIMGRTASVVLDVESELRL